MTLVATAAVLVPRWRTMIVAPVVLLLAVGLAAGDQVVDFLQRWSGETPSTILIDGEPVRYTGTTHRLLQVRVYAEAVAHAGWLGYGSTALDAQQTTIPYVDEELRQMFSSIDNHFLQFTLQCGFLGIGLFVVLCGASIAYAWQAVKGCDGVSKMLSAAVGGALLSVTLLVSSVWLATDFRFLLLSIMGLAGGLKLLYVGNAPPVAAPVPFRSPNLRLSPGYRASWA
jgi:O-antigen ligase